MRSRETSEAGARSKASPVSRTEHRAESLKTAATSSRCNGVWTRRRAGYSGLHVLQEGLQQLHQVGHRVRRQMQPVRVPHAASEAGRSSTYITSPGPAPGCWQPFKKAAASSERESANWRIASERDAAKRRALAVCAWRAPRTWRT